MNRDFLDTIYLFSCGMRGIEPCVDHKVNVPEVFKISVKQGIWDTVFLAVIKLYKKDSTILPEAVFTKLNGEFLVRCTRWIKKLAFVHKIIKRMEAEGISCCVLKGESVAKYYNTPSARISSDTDILIDAKKDEKCLAILEEEGFSIKDRHFESHQIECFHSSSGLIEIHTRMYGVKTNDVTFNDEISYDEEYVPFLSEDGTELKTLGYTDNALFLIMHFLKHFISQGVGIRQLADTLLYIENNYDKIDFKRVNNHLSSLGFSTIFNYVCEIGRRYLEFPKDLLGNCHINENLLNKILEDMNAGGLFGKEADRKGFYDLYLSERYKKFNSGNISSYYNKRKLLRLFPGRKFLSINYPYVEKTPFLVPIAWGHRIFDSLTKKKDEKINNEHVERLKFLKELDMV